MKTVRIYVLLVAVGVTAFVFSQIGTAITGPMLYLLYAWFIGLMLSLVLFWKTIAKWIGLLSVLFLTTSCNFIPSDQIGVWVRNFGRTPNDYSIVMGKFPMDWTRSTWSLTFPGRPFTVDVEPFKVNSKDGIQFTVDPTVSTQLIRSNEACRKYAFKLSSYKDDIDSGLREILLKEVLDAVRNSINSATGDSVMFNQSYFSSETQERLISVLNSKYGIEVLQFSMGIQPPQNLQSAINDRLLAEQEAKKTLASLATEEAKLKLEAIKAEQAKIQQAALTPAMLRKMELDAAVRIYKTLSESPNKVIVVGDPSKVVLNQ